MTDHSADFVKEQLEPFHQRISKVISEGHADWLAVKRSMAEMGIGPVLYPRTVANFVFDCVVRHALAEFGDDPDVHIILEPQTVKFVFRQAVLARFKKGDEENLGQNQPTQAVFDFVLAQATLPGFPAGAAKVEFLYLASDMDDGIASVIVAARDGDQLLWHYPIVGEVDTSGIVLLPVAPDDDGSDDPLVTPKIGDESERESE